MEWGLAHISAKELTEWMAFAQIEPFGERRADLRMAIVACLIANANRDTDKRPEPFTPADFMPEFGGSEADSPRAQTVDELSEGEQVAFLEMLNAMFGGQDLRKKE